MVVWKETIPHHEENEGHVDIDEVKWEIKMKNKETRLDGRICEHCGKRFKARGFKNHANKCGPTPKEGN